MFFFSTYAHTPPSLPQLYVEAKQVEYHWVEISVIIIYYPNISPGWLKTCARFSYTLRSSSYPLTEKRYPTTHGTPGASALLLTGRSSTGIAFVTVREGKEILGIFYFFRSQSPLSSSHITYP